MKILFTGGGSGGHFYPILSIVDQVRNIAKEKKILDPEIFFMSPDPYEPRALFDRNIKFIKVPAGKKRRYNSILNFFDYFKTGWGIMKSLFNLFLIYPDVVFGKGGYASFPALLSAKILGIPVIIHESDSVPGRVNYCSSKFEI
jgi:UDP-N-acetylglucosamine--N-acetylmuramyl-(pentapeptide) pyrophosphoryl-undecaprenol N-acetylglucosamine transferase